jgi:hypothetical protein
VGEGILFEESSIGLFLLVTVAMGGWAAWMTARGIASGWRPFWQCALALLVLASAVGAIGFRVKRTRQMTTQYRWLYERTTPLTWRERAGEAAPEQP